MMLHDVLTGPRLRFQRVDFTPRDAERLNELDTTVRGVDGAKRGVVHERHAHNCRFIPGTNRTIRWNPMVIGKTISCSKT